MRRLLLIPVLLLAACGDYSNEDILFVESIPNSQALTVAVPQQSAGALASGDAPLHALTVGSAQNLNGIVGFILELLDLVRQMPPSGRSADSRTWGPFDDQKHPGFQVEVTITRDGGAFDYAFSERATAGGSYQPVISGEFFTQSAHLGHGTLDFNNQALFQIGIDGGSPGLSGLNVVYANDTNPRTLQAQLLSTGSSDAGELTQIDLDYQQQPDSSGQLVFDAVADFAQRGPPFEDLHLISVWQSDGAGRSDGEISGGWLNLLFPNADLTDHLSECWNGQFQETYFESQAFDNGVGLDAGYGLGCYDSGRTGCPDGDPSSCVLPPGSN